MERHVCNKCGSVDVFIKAKNESQTGLYCNDCGAWIKWIGKNEKNLIEHQMEAKKVSTESKTTMFDYKYSLEIMKEQLNNKYISPEIKYAFKASIEALGILIKEQK